MARLLVGPSEFMEILTVVFLVEQCLFLVRELPMLETVGELVCPMCPDGDFNETERLQ